MKIADQATSARRIAAMVVAISCHLGLLMILLRPTYQRTDTTLLVNSHLTGLELRFIAMPRPTPPLASQAPQPVTPRDELTKEPASLPAQRAVRVTAQPKANSTNASSPPVTTVSPSVTAPPDWDTTGRVSAGDGGFRDRLLNAQHSQGVRGVPGSDTRVVPGIQLTNPMNQGVGAVMRSTQRLFGITDRHCIDVEVWQSLSPDELSARHLTPADVRSVGEKYSCNRPLGLSF